MTENEQKAAFAAFLLEAPTPLAAALKLFPSEKDRGLACRIAFEWPNDPEVILETERLKVEGTDAQKGLPTKEDIIRKLLDNANSQYASVKDKNAALRIIAEIQGHISKNPEDDSASKRMPTAPVYKLVSE